MVEAKVKQKQRQTTTEEVGAERRRALLSPLSLSSREGRSMGNRVL